MFNPGLKIGQVIKNADIVEIFKCGNMGGMRRSKTTNTLVLVSDYTKGLYHDKWIGGDLHYTGMGKSGDQDIHWAQNETLAESDCNGVDVHLFEVIDPGQYIYCGRIGLVSKPYIDLQPDEDGKDRKVWIFPIRPVPDNDVRKPEIFVFEDMDDYKRRGKNVDAEYIKVMADARKKGRKKLDHPDPVMSKPEPKLPIVIPEDLVGKRLRHKVFGLGKIMAIKGVSIVVQFDKLGVKKLGYEICMEKNLLDFIEEEI
ncbi:HNH endonuclease [Urinicoccus massiliensis]|uniref:HNH endonuclease n=1 Tax=Urinicoccus massiliensis TaxID=1723382 RepID=UPI0009318FB0|nr:HNH endonuclease [Urinicoccus massiliensis]